MARARRAGPHQKWPFLLTTETAVGVILAGAALVAGAVLLGRLGDEPSSAPPAASSTPDGAGTPRPATPTQSTANPAGSGTDMPAAVNACRTEVGTAEAVVAATRIAAGHWQRHVQARTDLLAQRNSLATTKAIWKATRLAGPADLRRVADADAAHALAKGGCGSVSGPAGQGCRQRLASLDAAARAGHAATLDWQRHLEMMAAHAVGEFGADHAQKLWVGAWQAAPKNLNALAEATAELSKAPSCNPG